MSYACCDVIPVLFVVDMLYGIELNKFLLFILKKCINVMDCRLMPLMALKLPLQRSLITIFKAYIKI